jgi:hypothetical protein
LKNLIIACEKDDRGKMVSKITVRLNEILRFSYTIRDSMLYSLAEFRFLIRMSN